MKLFALFFLAVLTAHAAERLRVFGWQDFRDERTGESSSAFYLAPEIVMQCFQADARGDAKTVEALSPKIPQTAKLYVIVLRGDAKSHTKASIRLFDGPKCGTEFQIDSGVVKVDPKAGTVSVSLKLEDNGQVTVFEGNGTFEMGERQPNLAQPAAPSSRG